MSVTRLRSRDLPVVALATITITAGLVAVNATNPQPAAAQGALQTFPSCANLAMFYRAQIDEAMKRSGSNDPAFSEGGNPSFNDFGGVAFEANARSAVGMATGALGNAPAASGTGTNVQEQGVDEADSAKVHDGILVTVINGKLVLADVSADKPVQLGALALRKSAPKSSYNAITGAEVQVDGDRVLVSWSTYATDQAPYPTTQLALVDSSSPQNPRLVWQQEIQGNALSSRLVNGRVRLVLSSAPVLNYTYARFNRPSDHSQWTPETARREVETVAAKNRQILQNATGEDFLPKIVTRDSTGKITSTTPFMSCDAVYHPKASAGANTLSVATLNLSDDDPITDVTGLVADGDMVYASTSRLYVATTRGGWSWVRRSNPGTSTPETDIHAFDISGANQTRYTASGTVDGWLLGRWAMSEQDGLLRVATTRDKDPQPSETAKASADPSESTSPTVQNTDSAVTTLREEGGALAVVGSVGGLGKSEQIRAVRWFGDTAVVVTFRQTDPLYVVNLATPEKPTLSGALKVNGYSEYLHPLGNELLLGVGQDATERGWNLGTQLSVFDVADPAKPIRIDTLVEKATSSLVENDSRAFSYLPSKRIALIPVDYMMNGGWQLVGYHVGDDGALTRVGSLKTGQADKAVVVDGSTVVAVPDPTMNSANATAITKIKVDDMTPTGSLRLG